MRLKYNINFEVTYEGHPKLLENIFYEYYEGFR